MPVQPSSRNKAQTQPEYRWSNVRSSPGGHAAKHAAGTAPRSGGITIMSLATPAQRAETARFDPGLADADKKALYRVSEVMRLLSLSRSVIYHQLRVGRLRSVKQGNARLIPAAAIADYVALLESEAEARR
jgi:excisionase family DNA binding protein